MFYLFPLGVQGACQVEYPRHSMALYAFMQIFPLCYIFVQPDNSVPDGLEVRILTVSPFLRLR